MRNGLDDFADKGPVHFLPSKVSVYDVLLNQARAIIMTPLPKSTEEDEDRLKEINVPTVQGRLHHLFAGVRPVWLGKRRGTLCGQWVGHQETKTVGCRYPSDRWGLTLSAEPGLLRQDSQGALRLAERPGLAR